jgi:hypothetical protein
MKGILGKSIRSYLRCSEISVGTIFTLDPPFSNGRSSDWADIVAFVSGSSTGEGAHPIDTAAFYYPSALAIVSEAAAGALGASAAAMRAGRIS